MDIVLEVLDTYALDHVYATAYPARPAPYDYPFPPSNETQSQQVFSSWTYKPATIYFSTTPGPYAYMSAWPRDNIWRQSLSLFFTVWYAMMPCPRLRHRFADQRS